MSNHISHFYTPDSTLPCVHCGEDRNAACHLPSVAASPLREGIDPQMTEAMLKSAERAKTMFVPVSYVVHDDDLLCNRMLKKIHSIAALAQHLRGFANAEELRAIHSAAVAGIDGPEPDEPEPVAAPAPRRRQGPDPLKDLHDRWMAQADGYSALRYEQAAADVRAILRANGWEVDVFGVLHKSGEALPPPREGQSDTAAAICRLFDRPDALPQVLELLQR